MVTQRHLSFWIFMYLQMLKQTNIGTPHYSSIRQTKQDSPSINQVVLGPNITRAIEDIDLSLYVDP